MNTKLAYFIIQGEIRKKDSLAERVMGIRKEQNFCGRALEQTSFSFLPELHPFML